MKIVYVTSSLPHGPGEAFIIPEIEELLRQGHEVLLVPMYPRGAVFHERAKALLGLSRCWPVFSFSIAMKALAVATRSPAGTLSALAQIIRHSKSARMLIKNLVVFPKGLWLASVIKAWGAQHIHAHWVSTTATMALVAAEHAKIPWSFTAHRWDIAENNMINLKARKASFGRAIDKRGACELATHANCAGWSPYLIHMGVELTATDKECIAPLTAGAFPIVVAANFVKKKGHMYLIEAVRLLRDRGVRVSLDLAGDGPLRAQLEAMVIQYELNDVVNFLGQIPHGQLMSRLRDGEWVLMVLPSIEDHTGAREGIPVSLMEAMSCGIPVLSTSTGGIPELLDEGAGAIVAPEDANALANAIQRMEEDAGYRIQLATNGMRRVREQFNLTQVVSELATMFARKDVS